jgi:hypothetical protein
MKAFNHTKKLQKRRSKTHSQPAMASGLRHCDAQHLKSGALLLLSCTCAVGTKFLPCCLLQIQYQREGLSSPQRSTQRQRKEATAHLPDRDENMPRRRGMRDVRVAAARRPSLRRQPPRGDEGNHRRGWRTPPSTALSSRHLPPRRR